VLSVSNKAVANAATKLQADITASITLVRSLLPPLPAVIKDAFVFVQGHPTTAITVTAVVLTGVACLAVDALYMKSEVLARAKAKAKRRSEHMENLRNRAARALQDKDAQIGELRRQVDSLRTRNLSLRSDLAEAKHALNRKDVQINHLEGELRNTKAKLERCEGNIYHLNKELRENKMVYDSQLSSLTRKLDALTDVVGKFQDFKIQPQVLFRPRFQENHF